MTGKMGFSSPLQATIARARSHGFGDLLWRSARRVPDKTAPVWGDLRQTYAEVDLDDDEPLQLLYTRGTESRPEGAALSRRNLVAQYVSCIVDDEDRPVPPGTVGENVASREVKEVLYQHPAAGEDALKPHCRERLAGFKVPKRIVFVEALPKNASGKILKRELRERIAG